MRKAFPLHPADLHGLGRLGLDAVRGTTQLVEAVHRTIATRPLGPLAPLAAPVTGIAGLVFRSILGINAGVGHALDRAMRPWLDNRRGAASPAARETLLAVLNGVLGDHLARSGNPLAIPMQLRRDGRALDLAPEALRRRFDPPGDRVAVFVHGLCMHDGQWSPPGGEAGLDARLQARGWSTLHLHYNTGLHIAANGRAFAAQLDALLAAWPRPVASLAIVAHSMGGLVARSACHVADADGQAWLAHLRHLVFLGTPHLGAPLERAGNRIDRLLATTPYTAPFARLGRLRSAGITDLRHGTLTDDASRDRFAHAPAPRTRVPLPAGVRCHAIAGHRADASRHLLGDGLVPIDSALGRHADPDRDLGLPARRTWIAEGVGHLDLLHHPAVQARVLRWLDAPPHRRQRPDSPR